MTPEKLLYVLRHTPELAKHIGLLVFDEGHQFDSGTRGITYELLLTSLRSIIPEESQRILISAVITNAEAVGEWLSERSNVVEGTTLVPTFRSIGFASWHDQLGRIEYVDSSNIDNTEFFVPRVIEKFELTKMKSNEAVRYFPDKEDNLEIALYLGLKLVSNGSVSIFCGVKSTATSICEKAIDVFERSKLLRPPTEYSEENEVKRLAYLHEKNLGIEATATKAAALGIFSHHGNTPHGIRLAVEHAMRANHIHFIVCTSTLAQGVNLPIRYLIVAGVYQGTERIKVRDFHNLIGRAGRAGMHTEGSILFADPKVFDKRRNRRERWRWETVKELLDPSKSEDCVSSLFQLIPLIIHNDRYKSSDKKAHTLEWDILIFAEAYLKGKGSLVEIITEIASEHGANGFTIEVMIPQFEFFSLTLSSIESFLLSHWGDTEQELSAAEVAMLAEQTLAYFLADEDKKRIVKQLFEILANNIAKTIPDATRRRVFGKTLYGVNDAVAIESWVNSNLEAFYSAESEDAIFDLVWPLLTQFIRHKAFDKFNNKDILKEIIHKWISGVSFDELFHIAHVNDCRLGSGKRPRRVKIDNIIDICEGGISYDGSLLISVICEFIGIFNRDGTEDLIKNLQLLQKRFKYGLPTDTVIACYELGFSDRVISQELTDSLKLTENQKSGIVRNLKKQRANANSVVAKYPLYFQERLNEMLF